MLFTVQNVGTRHVVQTGTHQLLLNEILNVLHIDLFLAVVFIGGLATISGSIMGAVFVVMLPKLVQELSDYIPLTSDVGQGGLFTVFQLQSILFGVLIVVFLVLEPRGLYGLWIRVRNYFKAWPFSY